MSPLPRCLEPLACPILAAAALCASLFLGVTPREARADTVVSLFKSFAGNINYVTTGNTLRAAPNNTYAGGAPCSLLSGNTGTSVDAGTSASPLSGIPAGSTIVAAYLYYAGSGATVDSAVTFNGTNVTASRTFTSTTGGHNFFSGFVDVTSLVTGNGSYSFGGLAVDNSAGDNCANSTVLAGWALTVVYSNSSEKSRVINFFDGFEAFAGSSITLTPNNFQIPSTGIDGKFSVITWEGDPDINSNNGANTLTETLEFNGNVLSDACNPLADTSLPNGSNGGVFVSSNPNQYNSTINTLSCTGNLTPTGDEQYFGVDFDSFDVSAYLAAGQTSATTFYSTGQDTVFLTAQIISVTNTPVADLGITKAHNGTFGYGDNGTYTLTVQNNGPATETGTVTVTDTLPTGLSYVSAAGTGWVCSFTSPTVTCTDANGSGLTNGASLPAITLTVNVQTGAPASISNTATVSGQLFDNNAANNSSTDTVTPVHPDLTTSAKSVVNTAGGDALVGSTLQYTLTLTETAGVAASGVSVTDDVPANVSGFTVTAFPAGATNTSTGAGTGANNDGFVNVTGITVPASSSVTIVYTVQVASGTANCTNIDNTATVTNPGGSTTTVTLNAPTIVVAQSSCAASGNKILYVYDNLQLTRTPQAANGTGVTITGGNATATWTVTPAIAKNLVLPAQTVSVVLICQATNQNIGTNRAVTVQLLQGVTSLGTSPAVNCRNGPTAHTFSVAIGATTIPAGTAITMVVKNTSGTVGRHIVIFQKTAATGTTTSKLTFSATTVINVDSVTAYNAAYPATSTQVVYLGGNTVFVCAVISDPFGGYDIDPATGGTAPQITLTDPAGAVQVNAAAMTKEGATDCGGTANSADESFEYAYLLAADAPMGDWTASVTGFEGTEGTVTHTANGAFDVSSLVITKTVTASKDPVEGVTRPKSIPGATMQYSVVVQNNGSNPADSGSLVITDAVPANTAFYLSGATPFTFTDGSPTSGLSAPVVSFSNNGGGSYTYSPGCTRPCTDTAITNIKVTFSGSMNGKTGGTAPSFTLTYQVVLQ